MKRIWMTLLITIAMIMMIRPVFAQMPYKIEYRLENDAYYVRADNAGFYYISNNQTNGNVIASQGVINGEYSGITRIYMPGSFLFIKSIKTSQTLLVDKNFDYIEFDSTNAYYHYQLTIRTNNKSYIWNAGEANDNLEVTIMPHLNYKVTFEGENDYIFKIGEANQLQAIKDNLKVKSDLEGDLSSKIYVKSDNYSKNYQYIGQYEIIFGIFDKFDTEYLYTVRVLILDKIKPEIIDDIGDIHIGYSNELSIQEITKSLQVTDNHDLKVLIKLKVDTYTENKHKIGAYYMLFEAIDQSGNATEYKKNIFVIDDKAPEITGPKQINITYKDILSKEDILTYLNYSDEITSKEKLVITWIKDAYSDSSKSIGKYKVVISFKDTSANEKMYEFEIVVEAPKSNLIDLGTLERSDKQVVTDLDIQEFLVSKQVITHISEIYTIKENEYDDSTHRIGVYRCVIEKDDKTYVFLIKINKSETISDKVKEQENSKNGILYGTIGLISAILLVFVGIFIHKRRHKKGLNED